MDKIVTSKILDDAREKIAEICGGQVVANPYVKAKQILAISGTTDIECPECKGSTYAGYNLATCSHCDNGVIKYPWKVRVVLENGELPKLITLMGETSEDEKATFLMGTKATQQDMLNESWVKEVRQVVE